MSWGARSFFVGVHEVRRWPCGMGLTMCKAVRRAAGIAAGCSQDSRLGSVRL